MRNETEKTVTEQSCYHNSRGMFIFQRLRRKATAVVPVWLLLAYTCTLRALSSASLCSNRAHAADDDDANASDDASKDGWSMFTKRNTLHNARSIGVNIAVVTGGRCEVIAAVRSRLLYGTGHGDDGDDDV